MKKSKFNSQPLGLILGLILPIISMFVFYLFRVNELTFSEFVNTLLGFNILTKVLSLNVLPNLLLFFIFIWKDFLLSARGVLMATFILAGLVLLFRLIT